MALSHEKETPAPLRQYEEIIGLAATLYSVKNREEASIDEVVDAVCQAAQERNLKAKSEKPDWGAVKAFLKEILSPQSPFAITAKTMEILAERERVYCDARILTDIRPIFKEKLDEGTAAAIITHTIRIAYHEGPELKEFYVAIDGSNLDDLQNQITRAKDKQKSLKSMIERSGTGYISS